MTKMRKLFLRNRKSGIVHKNPTTERCNHDDRNPVRWQNLSGLVLRDSDRLCAYCFPSGAMVERVP